MSQPVSGTGNQRDKQRADTRRRVFEAALAEFRRVGFDDAQIDRIAKDAGVVRGTFYFHFPSKEHVLLELERELESELVERVVELRRRRRSVRTVLTEVIDAALDAETTVGDYGLMCAMLSIYVRKPAEPAFAEGPSPLLDELANVFARAIERGELRTELRPDRLANMFLTSVFGALLSGGDLPPERREALESLREVFLRGVRSKSSRPKLRKVRTIRRPTGRR